MIVQQRRDGAMRCSGYQQDIWKHGNFIIPSSLGTIGFYKHEGTTNFSCKFLYVYRDNWFMASEYSSDILNFAKTLNTMVRPPVLTLGSVIDFGHKVYEFSGEKGAWWHPGKIRHSYNYASILLRTTKIFLIESSPGRVKAMVEE